MNAMRYVRSRHPELRHPELSLVSLGRPVESDEGLLPPGATGTVVHVYPDERAYEVEFQRPFHAVATLEAAAIAE
jgi:uncharacterized protein DUF4926